MSKNPFRIQLLGVRFCGKRILLCGGFCSLSIRAVRVDCRHKIRRTAHRKPSLIENMGVDHRRLVASVAQEFLDRSDGVSVFPEARNERVSEGVAGGSLREARSGHRLNRSAYRVWIFLNFFASMREWVGRAGSGGAGTRHPWMGPAFQFGGLRGGVSTGR